MKLFIESILAGCAIGLGGLAYLSVNNRVLGALLFSFGLFSICIFELPLYTGKICYAFRTKNRKFVPNILVIYLGNFIGTGLIAVGTIFSNQAELMEKAVSLCTGKLNSSIFGLVWLGILCNICIYIAVVSFQQNLKMDSGKYLIVIFAVVIFIVIGAEHCVADMFYLLTAKLSIRQILYILIPVTIGNTIGGILLSATGRYRYPFTHLLAERIFPR